MLCELEWKLTLRQLYVFALFSAFCVLQRAECPLSSRGQQNHDGYVCWFVARRGKLTFCQLQFCSFFFFCVPLCGWQNVPGTRDDITPRLCEFVGWPLEQTILPTGFLLFHFFYLTFEEPFQGLWRSCCSPFFIVLMGLTRDLIFNSIDIS